MILPSAQPWLLTTEIGEETLIYDRIKMEAHNLNPSASIVIRHCLKKQSFSELRSALMERLDLEDDVAENLLSLTLSEFAEKGLIQAPKQDLAIQRRDFLKKWGTAAAVLPLIVSMSPPAAAVSASGCDCSGLPGTPTVTINVVRTCIGGTRRHTFDLSGSTVAAGCQICQYDYDVDNDTTIDFSSTTQSSFSITYAAALPGPNIQATFRIQGPCGAADISSMTLPAFPLDCP